MSEDEDSDTEDKEETELGAMEDQRSIILHLISQLKLGMDLTKVGWRVPLGLRPVAWVLSSLTPPPRPPAKAFPALILFAVVRLGKQSGEKARKALGRRYPGYDAKGCVVLRQYSSQSVSLAFDSLEKLLL